MLFSSRLKVSLNVENVKFPLARRHLHCVYRNWMDSMSGSDFIAEPLWIFLILLKDLSHFFAIIFGFVAILFRKTLFIGQEEEFFLGFIILVENHFKLQLIVNFQMHPVGLKLDHVVLLKCNDRLEEAV